MPLALYLAYERNKGQGSFWQPYIAMLPEQPGCAWLLQPHDLSQALLDAQKLVGRPIFLHDRFSAHVASHLTSQHTTASVCAQTLNSDPGILISYSTGSLCGPTLGFE